MRDVRSLFLMIGLSGDSPAGTMVGGWRCRRCSVSPALELNNRFLEQYDSLSMMHKHGSQNMQVFLK